MEYFFNYIRNKPEELRKLINYVSKNYSAKYKEIRDFSSILSFSIGFLGINSGHTKQVIFTTKNKKITEVCSSCNFPSKKKDLVKKGIYLCCRCCDGNIYGKELKRYIKIRGKINNLA